MTARRGTVLTLGSGLVVLGAVLLLGPPAYRTWQSYYQHRDYCGNPATQRIASAIVYIRQPSFRRRTLIQTKGRLDTSAPIDPAHCCSVLFGGRFGDYAITPASVFHGGATAAVRFDTLPPFTARGEKLSILTDKCGGVYELRS